MDAVAKLKVLFEADSSALDKSLGDTDKKVDGLSGKLGGVGKAAAVGGAAALGALGAVGAGLLSTIGPAEALGDAQARVGSVFGDAAAKQIEANAKVANSLGLSKTAYLEQVGALGDLSTSLGVGKDEAAKMAGGFAELGPKLAAFAGVEGDVAASALEQALKGKTKALSDMGVAVTDADLAAAGMRLGLQGEKKDWTEAQLAQATYMSVMDKTAKAQQAWADNSGDVETSMQRIGGAVEDAQAAIGQKLLPILAPLIEKLAAELPGAIDKVMSFLGPMFTFLTENPAIAMVVAALGTLAGIFGTIMAVVGPFIPVIMGVFGAFSSLAGIVGTIAALFNPVTLAIGAVVLIIAGLKLAWDNNLGGIQEKTAAVVEFIKAQWDAFVTRIKLVILEVVLFVAGIIEKWVELQQKIWEILGAIGQAITDKWTEFWTTITTKVQEIKDAVFEKWEEIKKSIGDALEFLELLIKSKWEEFRVKIFNALVAIVKAVTEKWEEVKKFITDAMEKIKTVIEEKWEQARKIVDDLVTKIRDIIKDVFDGLKDIVDKALGAVGDTIKRVIEGWKTIIENALKIAEWVRDAISGAVGAVGEALGNLISDAVEAAKGAWKTAVETGLNIVEWVKTAIDNAVSGITEKAGEIGGAILEGVGKGFEKFKDALKSKVASIVNLLPQWLRDMLGIASPAKVTIPIGIALAEGIAVGFERGMKNLVLPMLRKMTGGLVTDFMTVVRAMKGGPSGGMLDSFKKEPGQRGDDTMVKINQTGRGGFGAASKTNFWSQWVAKHGWPEESSARKAAAALGIPLPDWILDHWKTFSLKEIDPKLTPEGGIVPLLGELGAALEALIGTIGGLIGGGTTPGGGGSIRLPGGGLVLPPIHPPGGPPPAPPMITDELAVTASQVVVPSLTAQIAATFRPVIVIGNREIEAIAVQVDKILAERATLAVGP